MKTIADVLTYRLREHDDDEPLGQRLLWGAKKGRLGYIVTTNDATHPLGLDHIFLAGDTRLGTYCAMLGAALVNAIVTDNHQERELTLQKIEELKASLP